MGAGFFLVPYTVDFGGPLVGPTPAYIASYFISTLVQAFFGVQREPGRMHRSQLLELQAPSSRWYKTSRGPGGSK